MKHTPGPWRHHAGSILSPEFDDTPDGYCIAVIEDDGGYEAPHEERSGNASLIAAAPELLEALKWAIDQQCMTYRVRIPNQNDKWCDQIDKAKAAIAKAEGVTKLGGI